MGIRAGYIVATVTFGVGLGLAGILVQQLRGVADGLQQVVVPGEHEITLPHAGAHTIFHEQRADLGGLYDGGDRRLNDVRLRLQSVPTAVDIAITPPPSRSTYTVDDREGSAIATFLVPHPGTYRLTAWNAERSHDAMAVLAIGQGVERRVMTATFGSLAAAVSGLAASIAIAATTFRRARTEKRTSRRTKDPQP